MEILQTVPDELFSESLAFGLDSEDGTSDAGLQDTTSAAIALVLNDITDNVIFGFCLEIHRMCKKGVLFLEDTDTESTQQFKIVDTPGFDIFGEELKKKVLECVCPSCERPMAASRFAPHLEKCMGMGRCSSRVASRRIANNMTKQEGSDNDEGLAAGDNEHDNDWGALKRSKKLRKEKHASSLRGRGRPPTKTRAESAGGRDVDYQSLLLMSEEQRKTLLLAICGSVLSANEQSITKKLCNKTPSKCTLHTEEMRQSARQVLLPESKNKVGSSASVSLQVEEEGDIDIDTFDDLDNQILRDALWDKEVTPTASPADSTSTVNSSGSRKGRGRKKKSKRRD